MSLNISDKGCNPLGELVGN